MLTALLRRIVIGLLLLPWALAAADDGDWTYEPTQANLEEVLVVDR